MHFFACALVARLSISAGRRLLRSVAKQRRRKNRMTENERMLFVLVAGWVAQQDQEHAATLNTTSNLSDEIRRLIDVTGEERRSKK